MSALNRRDMLQLSAAFGVGAAFSEAAFAQQTPTVNAAAPAAENECLVQLLTRPHRHQFPAGCFWLRAPQH